MLSVVWFVLQLVILVFVAVRYFGIRKLEFKLDTQIKMTAITIVLLSIAIILCFVNVCIAGANGFVFWHGIVSGILQFLWLVAECILANLLIEEKVLQKKQ